MKFSAWATFLLLSMAPLPPIVNGAGISGKKESPEWIRFVEDLVKDGKAGKMGEGTARDSGLTLGSLVRGFVAPPAGNADERHRNIQAIITSTESPKVAHVVLQVGERNFKKGEKWVETFRLTPAGVLEQATLFEAKQDEAGRPIEGTDRVSAMPLESRKTKKALRRELDFWLRGKGRKTQTTQ